MKAKVYYWIAIVVLTLTSVFLLVVAQVQSGYAREAAALAAEVQNMAMEQQALAEQNAALAAEQAQVAMAQVVEAEAQAKKWREQLQACKGNK